MFVCLTLFVAFISFLPYFHNLRECQTGALEANIFNDSDMLELGERGEKPQQIKIGLSCIESQEKPTRELLV